LKEGKNLNIAPMGTASFFVIAMVDKFNRLLHVVRNDKKDIVDSGLGCSSKGTSVLLLIKRIIIVEK
jgi:hypothetical protein